MYVWSSLAASCPSSGTAVTSGQGSFKITLDDGPVQFLIDGSTTGSSVTYNPTFDSFAITSQIQLSNDKSDFSSYSNDPRLYLYEVISPNYKRMWVHSSLKQYIEARPWLIAMLSMNILSPKYIRNRLIHIPSSTCPTTFTNDVKKNTLISKMLSSLVYTESVHFVGQVANSTYYEFTYTVNGNYIQAEVPFLVGSTFILLSVIISSIISILSVIGMYIFLWRMRKILERVYHNYLQSNRKLSRFKKEIEAQNDENKRFTTYFQNTFRVYKVLKLGLFTTEIREKIIEIEDKNDDEIYQAMRKKKKASISVFKAPELYIDYIRRSRVNSFRMFLGILQH